MKSCRLEKWPERKHKFNKFVYSSVEWGESDGDLHVIKQSRKPRGPSVNSFLKVNIENEGTIMHFHLQCNRLEIY